MADPVTGAVMGAAFGEGFAILHGTVKHVVGKIIMFKSILKRLESTLDSIAPQAQRIKEENLALARSEEETKSLIEKMEKGKGLVLKCSKIKIKRCWSLNYCIKAYSYSKQLQELNDSIEKFCQVDLILQIAGTGLETLNKLNQNTSIALETSAKVDQNTNIAVETSAKVDQNTNIVVEISAKVDQNTNIAVETSAKVDQNTSIAVETSGKVDQNTNIAVETSAKVDQNTSIVLETSAIVSETSGKVDRVLERLDNSDVRMRFGLRTLSVPRPRDYIVGLDLPLKELKMELKKKEEQVLLLTALGGCGKTTLVKMLCWDHEIKGIYMDNIFFVSVSKTPNLKVMVQKLFSHNGDECPEFQSDEEAINWWEQLLNQIGPKPILLILDDVWPGSESLVEKFKFDFPNYMIVVTSRTAFPRFRFRYNLNPLNHEDAMKLFYHSASLQDGSSYIPEEDIEKIVRGCGGLPIALKVIGGSLSGQLPEVWDNTLTRWSDGHSIFESDTAVFACLQKSLEFSTDKIILKDYFMNLGSFPEDQKIPVTALIDICTELHEPNKGDVHVIANLHELNTRNLASLEMTRKDASKVNNYYNEDFITQHDVLRDLAIHLCNREPITERERLIVDIKGNNLPEWWMEQEQQLINARSLSISTDELFSSSWCNIQAPKVEALVLNFHTRNYTIPEFVEKMVKLKVIIVTNYGFFPAELSNFQLLNSLPNLKRIRLEKVSIPSLCNAPVPLRSVKKISLFMCNIGQAFGNSTIQVSDSLPSLMEINIDYCNDLVELPTWLCEVLSLKKLSITNCHKLSALPEGIGNLVNLEVLRFRSCTELSELPESIRSLHKLRILDISDCLSIIWLPKHIGELHNLEELHMKECLKLRPLPPSTMALEQLKIVVCDEERAMLWEPFKESLSNLKVMVAKKDINLNWLPKS